MAKQEVPQEDVAVDINAVIEGLLSENKTEDEIFTHIADATGKGILAAVRTYKQFLKDTGRVMTADQRKAKVKELTEKAVDTSGEEPTIVNLPALVEAIADALGVSTATAASNANKALEALGVVIEAKEKATGEVNQWLIDHPNCTRDEFVIWMEQTGRKKSTTAAYWSAFNFAKKCHTTWSTPAEA